MVALDERDQEIGRLSADFERRLAVERAAGVVEAPGTRSAAALPLAGRRVLVVGDAPRAGTYRAAALALGAEAVEFAEGMDLAPGVRRALSDTHCGVGAALSGLCGTARWRWCGNGRGSVRRWSWSPWRGWRRSGMRWPPQAGGPRRGAGWPWRAWRGRWWRCRGELRDGVREGERPLVWEEKSLQYLRSERTVATYCQPEGAGVPSAYPDAG